MPKLIHLPSEKTFMWKDFAEMRPARIVASDLPGLVSWLRWGVAHPEAAGGVWRLRLCQSILSALPPSHNAAIRAIVMAGDLSGIKDAALVPAHEVDREVLRALWKVHDRLLAVPNLWSGFLEGHPLHMRPASPMLTPIIDRLTTAILAHAAEGIAALRLVDRAITQAWGFPPVKREWTTSVGQLEKVGLELEVFED
jgi:acyl-CoA synthetase (AMP-forming)/AMP-acid ligase II